MDVPFPVREPIPFYGVDNNKFKLGAMVYEATEDGDDGYRSYLGSVVVRDGSGIFFMSPVDTVEAVPVTTPINDGDFDGWALRSLNDGHEWLRFGTENSSDYYPCFVFRYTPRTEKDAL